MSFKSKTTTSIIIMSGMVVLARVLGQLVFYLKHKKYYYDAEIDNKIRKREMLQA